MGTLLNRRRYMGGSESVDTRIVAVFNVTDGSSATQVVHSNAVSGIESIEIDGVKQSSVTTSYQLSAGEHTVKIESKNLSTTPSNLFFSCSTLKSVVIPEGVETLQGRFGSACPNLESITVPKSLKTVNNHAFQNSSHEKNVYISDIGAFLDITYGNSASAIMLGGAMLYLNGELVKNITMSVVNDYALYGCRSVESVIISSGVTTIGAGSFNDCRNLTSVTIPEGVTEIKGEAFGSYLGLSSIVFPSTVETIGNGIFTHCDELTSFTCLATTPPTMGTNVFRWTHNSLVIYVPAVSVESYKAANNWSSYASRIQAIPT